MQSSISEVKNPEKKRIEVPKEITIEQNYSRLKSTIWVLPNIISVVVLSASVIRCSRSED